MGDRKFPEELEEIVSSWDKAEYPVYNSDYKHAGYFGYPEYATAYVKGDRIFLRFRLSLVQNVGSDRFLEHLFDFLAQHKDKTVLVDASEFPEHGIEGIPNWSESRMDHILAAMATFPNLRLRAKKYFYDRYANWGATVKGTPEEHYIVPID
jgi:hypothetical protein